MKKFVAVLALVVSLVACNKSAESTSLKTAYIDTEKLMKEYTGAKDIEAKYRAKGTEMGRELEAEKARFERDIKDFENKARAYGEIWANQNAAPLQRRQQQLGMAQEQLLRQLQQESAVEMDSLVSNVRTWIKDYGKAQGYDYIFASGDVVSVAFAKDQYDITDEMIKVINEKYKAKGAATEAAAEPAKETTAIATDTASKK